MDHETSTHYFYSTNCVGCECEFDYDDKYHECCCNRKYCEECVLDYVTLWQKDDGLKKPMFCKECKKYTPYDKGDKFFDPQVIMWLIASLGLQDKDSEKGSNRYFFTSYKNAVKAYDKKSTED